MLFEILNLKLIYYLYLDVADKSFHSFIPAIPSSNSFKDPLPSQEKFSGTLKLHKNCLSSFP